MRESAALAACPAEKVVLVAAMITARIAAYLVPRANPVLAVLPIWIGRSVQQILRYLTRGARAGAVPCFGGRNCLRFIAAFRVPAEPACAAVVAAAALAEFSLLCRCRSALRKG